VIVLPDLNLLVYAHNRALPWHEPARVWWEGLLVRGAPVALPWVVVLGFVRLVTHPRVLVEPLAPGAALDRVEGWLARPAVRLVEPGPRHLAILRGLLEAAGTAGSLTTDAHLAALAIEHGCTLHSNDADFCRFPGLSWRNPLRP
jgi:toxin-antitoxin system PIN domain toxin